MDFVLSPLTRPSKFCFPGVGKIGSSLPYSLPAAFTQRHAPRSALNPAIPNMPGSISSPTVRKTQPDRRNIKVGPLSTPQPPPALSSTSPKTFQRFAKRDDSDLSNDRALPLPMTYPNSQPLPQEDVEKMLACDPEVANCNTVVYQWTDKCQRCRGTGLVDVARRKGKHHVISTCVACTGIGFVQRYTTRDDIPIMIDPDANQGGK